jgi:GAF domain-containing protein
MCSIFYWYITAERKPVIIADTQTDHRISSANRDIARGRGYRSFLAVPLVLLAMALTYVTSGIVVRIAGIVRRRLRRPTPEPERQIG